MKELVCNYALVRFLPYRETGEFVNIGVVLYAPEIVHFDFRLTQKRNRRVRAFFPEMDVRVYSASVDSLHREMERQKAQFTAKAGLFSGEGTVGEGLTAFRAMLRRRETLLHFAEPGMKLGAPPEVLDKLYSEYVLRSFARTAAYQEQLMRSQLRQWLTEWGLRTHYRSDQRVGDEMFHLTLPFVHFEGQTPTVAIKPLDLDRREPTDVFDHVGMWVQRFRRLAQRGRLPARMLVPLQLPAGIAREAAEQVASELRETGIQTTDFNDAARVRELAAV